MASSFQRLPHASARQFDSREVPVKYPPLPVNLFPLGYSGGNTSTHATQSTSADRD